jgi:N-glycosylase/DNA lyase
MNKLYEKLKDFDIRFEEQDKQFLDIQKLEKVITDKEVFLALLIANSIVCYQLLKT